MRKWKPFFLLYILLQDSYGNHRGTLLTKKMTICPEQLPQSQSFTPGRNVIDCTRLYVASGSDFILVRHGAQSDVWCGHTSSTFGHVLCSNSTVEIDVYDIRTKCTVPCVGWYRYKGITFCVHVTSTRAGQAGVESTCTTLGGDGIMIDTPDDLDLLHSITSEDFWVPANDHHTPGEYTWSNGDLVKADFFQAGEPDISSQHCLAFSSNTGGLFNCPCVSVLSVVCRISCL